jgi:CubicO group peptidase (beta-lactamase class C family)
MKENRIVGLSIGVVKDGELFYTKGYGFTSVDSLYKVTEHTVFHTASITKVFTASAIMQFVDRGEIKLTDKLTDHLPDFKMKDKRYQQITIEHLLTHSSGLPWEHKFKNSPNDSTALEQFVSDLKN